MNHNFRPKQLTPALCEVCAKGILAHSKTAECEVCSAKVGVNLFMTILMCPSCELKEKELQIASKEGAEKRLEDLHLAENEIKSYGDFFNAKVTPIVALKEVYELNGHSYSEFHEKIRLQIEHLQRVLFETVITTTDDTISNLLIDFRAEIRTKLKSGDINYQPPIKAPKVTVRLKPKSALDKMAEMVIAAEGKKGNVITMIEAKRKLKDEMGLKE